MTKPAEDEPLLEADAETEDGDELASTEPGTAESGTGRLRKRSAWRRKMKRSRRRVGLWLVSLCGPFVLGRLARTWHLVVRGEEHLGASERDHRGHFMALWHGRMVVGLPHHGHRNWAVLVSSSGDGDISRRLLEGFGYRVVRGSTSKGGSRALREMLTVLDTGAVMIITPDGPRGPRHTMNPGLAWMARATGYPVIPLGFGVDRAWRLKSWDRFTIPKPGARVVMRYGEPVHVPRKATPADLERATEEIQARLVAAEAEAYRELGCAPDW